MDTTSADNTTDSGFTDSNPFAHESTLPYHAPQFDKIRDSDYAPAIEEGMRLKLSEIEQIASSPEPPTFDNTVIAMEKSGKLLKRVLPVFFSMTGANTNDTLQEILSEEAPKLAAHKDAIMLNDKLFERVKSIYDKRADLGLTPQQNRLLERYYLDFIQAGALLSDPDKERLRAIHQETAKLRTDFQIRLLKATANGALIIDDKTMLDGLNEDEIAAAAQAANLRGLSGKWVIPLQNTTQQPAQARLNNRNLRKELFDKSTRRTELGDGNDTRQIILRLTELRAEKAGLLGYDNFAEYTFQNRMAKTPEAAVKLLEDITPAAMTKAEGEAEKMRELARRQNGRFDLKPWDWQFYAEKVRIEGFDLDETRLKPYFELNRVLKDGVFFAAGKLYGLTFRERKDIPVYHPDVHVFEVLDAEGQSIALWYCDYFKRDNKDGGAWSGEFIEFSGLLQTLPVVYNVCNYTKPAAGQPALLSYNDVTTMFHEFGHALHSFLNRIDYPRLASNVPEDFVEVPSQFNEHWALYPEVLDNYAKHYKTGEPMPADLVGRVRKAKTFNMGFATLEYLESSLLDMAWHTLAPGTEVSDIESFETATLRCYDVYMPLVPPRYRSTYFAHIWEGGYSAGYYSYMWSEVIENDAFEWFKENGGLTRENGERFRDMILSRIGEEDPDILYRAFRGQDPDIKAMLAERGLTEK
ncbi:MAG: M3 family metallopeptidase [Acidobacteriota bacterium]